MRSSQQLRHVERPALVLRENLRLPTPRQRRSSCAAVV